MKILAIDTASQSCSVAILDRDLVTAEMNLMRRQTHSRHLHEMIHRTLNLAGVELSQIDGFAVTRGPGSFTGLRIGLSFAKGLAFSMKKPIVGVSSLEALARQAAESVLRAADCPRLIRTVIDARKKEVYAASFELDDRAPRPVGREGVCSPDAITDGIDRDCIFIGDGALLYRDRIEKGFAHAACFPPEFFSRIQARTVGMIALARLERKEHDNLASLVPSYIRQSDAELRLVQQQF